MLDEIDEKIIMDLENRGLQSIRIMADSYGVSERTVRRRIKNIIDSKLLRTIVAPNIVSLGFRAWARIGIGVAPGAFHRVSQALVAHPSVYFVAATLGRFDIMTSVYFDTIEMLTYFVSSELTRIKGIRFVETILLVQPRKYNLFSWPEPIFRGKRGLFVPDNYYELDEIEKKILKIMMEDGPLPPKILSSRLGIRENSIRKRLKVMQKNEVYKIEAVPLEETLEYAGRATTGITINNSFPHKIIGAILEHPAVFLAAVTLGRFNIVIGTRFRNANALEQFLTGVLTSVPGVASMETYLHVKRLKYFNVKWPIQ